MALKLLPSSAASDPGRRERFEREAQAVAALNHPGILTIHSVEEADGQFFLTMELVEGGSLADAMPQPIDARSDLFSLGVFLYEMATGQRPFTGDTSISITSSIVKDTPTSVTESTRRCRAISGASSAARSQKT